jgi:hypothetical protein
LKTISVIAIPLLLLASVMGCIEDRAYDRVYRPEIAFEISSVLSYRLNDSRSWEVRGPITIVRDVGRVTWSSLAVVLSTFSPSQRQNLTFEPRPEELPSTPHLYFIDMEGDPGSPDEGDIIGAIGLSRKHQMASITILGERGSILGQARIMNPWNESFTLSLAKGPTMMPRWPGQLPNMTITIESMVPDWERTRWSDIGYQVGAERLYECDPFLPFPPEGAQNVTAGIYFKEAGAPDGLVDPGETIRIVRMPEEWFGKDLVLGTANVEIGRRALPEFFTQT